MWQWLGASGTSITAQRTAQVSKFFGWIELYHNQTGILVHIKVLVKMVSSKVDAVLQSVWN